jgi:hypothetical protein
MRGSIVPPDENAGEPFLAVNRTDRRKDQVIVVLEDPVAKARDSLCLARSAASFEGSYLSGAAGLSGISRMRRQPAEAARRRKKNGDGDMSPRRHPIHIVRESAPA